jgi:hypothetical protein
MTEPSLLVRAFFRNGAILIIPPMIITFGLWSFLPAAYGPELFWKDIPHWLGLLENCFRILVFALPGFLYFGKRELGQPLGWYLYVGGLVIYLISYLIQVFFPLGAFSQSLVGFTAPAWSTLAFFVGIGLVCKHSWLPIPWYRTTYLVIVVLFLIFHVWHSGLVYFNLSD